MLTRAIINGRTAQFFQTNLETIHTLISSGIDGIVCDDREQTALSTQTSPDIMALISAVLKNIPKQVTGEYHRLNQVIGQ